MIMKKTNLSAVKASKKTKQIKHRKVTIDELALMIGKGFRGVDTRFDKIENEIILMKERLDRIEMKLDSLERRILAIEDILTKHGRNIEEMKNDIKEIKGELKALKKADNGNSDKIFGLEQRIKVLETKLC